MSDSESDKPEEPSEEDCCQNGCTPCVFDIYKNQLKLWQIRGHSISIRNDLLSQTRFKSFTLESITSLTINTNLYKFYPVTEGKAKIKGCLHYKAGQHLFLRLNDNGARSNIITRAYTIVTNREEQENCSFQVLIKLYKDGVMSNYVRTLLPGDTTYWRGPYGEFIYQANKFRNVLMICIGTGIAPMYAIIQEILNNEDDETMIMLMYGCRNISEIILREELYKLSSYWNFNYICYLTQSFSASAKKFSETFINKKISKEHIKSFIKFPLKSLQVLVCGSTNFTDEVFNYLISFEVPNENVHVF